MFFIPKCKKAVPPNEAEPLKPEKMRRAIYRLFVFFTLTQQIGDAQTAKQQQAVTHGDELVKEHILLGNHRSKAACCHRASVLVHLVFVDEDLGHGRCDCQRQSCDNCQYSFFHLIVCCCCLSNCLRPLSFQGLPLTRITASTALPSVI